MDIVKYTKDTLSNIEILNLTANNKAFFLRAINPVAPYVEYEIIDEYGTEYADGKEIGTTYVIQVDIFSKEDYHVLEKAIRKHMLKAGFNRDMAADLYEENTRLYHKAMRFNITLEATQYE